MASSKQPQVYLRFHVRDPNKDRKPVLDVTVLDQYKRAHSKRHGPGEWLQHLRHGNVHIGERLVIDSL